MQQLECDCAHNAHKGTHNGFGANSITPGKAAWSHTDHKCTRWNSGVFPPAPSTFLNCNVQIHHHAQWWSDGMQVVSTVVVLDPSQSVQTVVVVREVAPSLSPRHLVSAPRQERFAGFSTTLLRCRRPCSCQSPGIRFVVFTSLVCPPGSDPCRNCLCVKRRQRAVHLRRRCQWTRARGRRLTPRKKNFVVRLKHSLWRGRRGAPHGRHGHCHHRHDGSTLDGIAQDRHDGSTLDGIAQSRTGCSSSTNNKNDKDKSTQRMDIAQHEILFEQHIQKHNPCNTDSSRANTNDQRRAHLTSGTNNVYTKTLPNRIRTGIPP